jgi:hypothetical protein
MRLLAVVALCACLAGCGAIGPVQYPALKIPFPAKDLSAVERGDHIDIYFTTPATTTEGLTIKQLASIDLRVGPNPESTFSWNQWAASAKRIEVKPPAELGQMFQAHIPAQEFVGKDVIIGVRFGNDRGRMSEWSNPVTLPVQTPVPTPTNLKVMPVAEGVKIEWSAPDEKSFKIFRRGEQDTQPSLLDKSDGPEYLDKTAEYGKSYDYYVLGLNGQAESDAAGPKSTGKLVDTFPPAVPTGVTAILGTGTIEISWNRNTESDFKEYRVFRSVDGGPFAQIATGLAAAAYSDHDVVSGKRFAYRVVAVDQLGNASEPSAESNPLSP